MFAVLEKLSPYHKHLYSATVALNYHRSLKSLTTTLSEFEVKGSVYISGMLPCEVSLLFGDIHILIRNSGLIQYWYILFSSHLALHVPLQASNKSEEKYSLCSTLYAML